MIMRNTGITYAVYDRDDNILMVGDKKKVIEYTGYSGASIDSLVCRIRKGERHKSRYMVYRIED